MRIQEMRSGLEHLKRNADEKRRDNIFEMRSLLEPDLLAVAERLEREMPVRPPDTVQPPAETRSEPDSETRTLSDLEEPLWAVVSFERIEATGLTYEQAVSVISELELRGVTGLCIVTAEAASRIKT